MGGTRAGRTQGKVVLCSCGCNPEREGLVQGLSGPTRAQGLGSRCSQHPHPLPDSWLTSPAVPWASAPLQAGLGPLQAGAWWQVGVGGSSATVPSQGPHPRGWPQCARGAPAPGQVGFPSHGAPAPPRHGWSCAPPHHLRSKEKNSIVGPQKGCQLPQQRKPQSSWPAATMPAPPLLGQEVGGGGEGGCWGGWSRVTANVLREQLPTLSLTRSVTLGRHVPSLDLSFPSVIGSDEGVHLRRLLWG